MGRLIGAGVEFETYCLSGEKVLRKQDIIRSMRALDLPKADYWITSGAGLVMHGVKAETRDIDIGCTTKLCNDLIRQGMPITWLSDGTKRIKINEIIEAFENWSVDRIDEIENLPVASLESIKAQKVKLGRDKDRKDIELIDAIVLNQQPIKSRVDADPDESTEARIFVRIGATAFLFNQTKVLLMKRSMLKKIAPGLWSGVGGHAEPHELNDPLATCLREVFEETGIPAAAIFDLKLKYIMLRKSTPREMRLSYFYFGRTDRREVIQTPEGELYWVETGDVGKLEMSPTYNLIFSHYLTEGMASAATLVGVVTPDGAGVSWAELG